MSAKQIISDYHDIDYPTRGSKYTIEQRQYAAYLYLMWGTTKKIAQEMGIPKNTIGEWTRQDWWEQLTTKLRLEKKDEIDSTLTRVTDKLTGAIENKVDNPDDISLRDLTTTYGILFDKQRLLRNEPTSIKGGVTNDQLESLKAQFESLVGQTIEGERVD